jgi:hypothetical protein
VAIATSTGDDLKGIRDRAVLLIGFAAACRFADQPRDAHPDQGAL